MMASREDLDQIPIASIGDIHSVRIGNLTLDVRQLHFVNTDEVRKTRFIGDQVRTGFKSEDPLHEFLSGLGEKVNTFGRSQLNPFPLERTIWDDVAVICHALLTEFFS
ncbi:MAG: hypothetical protein IH892_17080 [Planctomycetes bacterium]|nr:hypothetical protein [Planctomycetota bacterium]